MLALTILTAPLLLLHPIYINRFLGNNGRQNRRDSVAQSVGSTPSFMYTPNSGYGVSAVSKGETTKDDQGDKGVHPSRKTVTPRTSTPTSTTPSVSSGGVPHQGSDDPLGGQVVHQGEYFLNFQHFFDR